jgi:N-methylhydantoinase A
LPEVPVTISSSISPEFREFERTSTCVLNAYLLPVTQLYVDSLAQQLRTKHSLTDLRIMQASGGSMTAEAAKSRAVHMVNSGPAGGALASALFGSLAGEERVIGVDMGGTSFDVSLIVNGEPRLKAEGEFEGYPVKVPMIDVEGIGAGGGSIARVDAGGALTVGPESAGADPGPACYGRAGKFATVTDANLVLSRLNPEYFLGGEMELYVEPARAAILEHVANPLGISVPQAAAGIIRVVNANMVRGISVNSTQKGFDVREFSLLAFGGAGPLHAVELAHDLGMSRVIIPPFCSVFSAFGAVASDVRHDYVRTTALSQDMATAESLEATFQEVEAEAKSQLAEQGVAEGAMQLQRSADIRYLGQSYELSIPLDSSEPLTEDGLDRLIQDFHTHHQRIYSYRDESEAVEIMALRLAAIGQVPKLNLLESEQQDQSSPVVKDQREVFFPDHGFVETIVLERESLNFGQQFLGPSLVEERTSTTVIPPDWRGLIDGHANIILTPVDPRAEQAQRSQTADAQVEV